MLLCAFLCCVWGGSSDVSGRPRAGPQSGLHPLEASVSAYRPCHPQVGPFSVSVSREGLLMDGVQVGHYFDSVFAFGAELGPKIGLGEVAAQTGILCGQQQVWGSGRGSS